VAVQPITYKLPLVNSLGFGTSSLGIDPAAAAIEERRALRVRALLIAIGVLAVIAVFAGAFLLGRAHGAAPPARASAPSVAAPSAANAAPALGLAAAPAIALPAPPPVVHTTHAPARSSSAAGVFSSTASGSTATSGAGASEQAIEPAVSAPADETPAPTHESAPAQPAPTPKHSSSSGGGSFENSG
jgi:hypothetical protein